MTFPILRIGLRFEMLFDCFVPIKRTRYHVNVVLLFSFDALKKGGQASMEEGLQWLRMRL